MITLTQIFEGSSWFLQKRKPVSVEAGNILEDYFFESRLGIMVGLSGLGALGTVRMFVFSAYAEKVW